MEKYIRLTKPYLLFVTIFVVLRFVLELAGVNEELTSEISLTRLVFILPIFLGLRFGREGRGFGEMLAANLVYIFWGFFLVMIVVALSDQMALGTHYGAPLPGMSLGEHLLAYVVFIAGATLLGSILSLIASKFSAEGATPRASA